MFQTQTSSFPKKKHSLRSSFFTVSFFSNTHTHLLRSSPHTIAPMKSQGSSRYKGKKAIFTLDVGEEAEYSESKHSDEEEAQRDPNSEYASLIDSWYEVHPHFPKILSDYAPPLSGHVWLALSRQNPDVSWALMASLIPDLVIPQGILLPMPIHFEFGSGTALGWREWVDNELSNTSFMGLLQRASVLKAIVSSHCLSNF